MQIPSKSILSLTALLSLGSLASCGKKADEPAKTTQVVAKVNGEEITVSQLNFSLSKIQGSVPQAEVPRIKKEMLERLVEHNVLVQNAIEKKLDREPDVQQQLDLARREVLARAMVDRVSNSVAKPTEQEIDKYFDENPRFFQQRQIFKFDEMLVPLQVARRPEVAKMLDAAKSMPEVAEKMREFKLDVPLTTNISRPAEELPMELVRKLPEVKDGELFRYDRGGVQVVAKVVDRRDSPLDKAKAKPVIERVLHNQKKVEAVPLEIKRLVGAAKVSYEGEYAPGAQAAQPTKIVEQEKPKSHEEQKAVVEKGLKGLK